MADRGVFGSTVRMCLFALLLLGNLQYTIADEAVRPIFKMLSFSAASSPGDCARAVFQFMVKGAFDAGGLGVWQCCKVSEEMPAADIQQIYMHYSNNEATIFRNNNVHWRKVIDH